MNSGECNNAPFATAQPHSVDSGEVRRQLARVIASDVFRGSLRLTRFLQFVVETTLAGKAGTIKAYTVAVEALGRNSDFDPQDPIVRVEALRLRAALARYYGGPGRDDVIIIKIPCGSYVPSFHRRTAADGTYAAKVAPIDRPPSGRHSLDIMGMADWAHRFERGAAEVRALEENRAAIAEEVRRTMAHSRRLLEELRGRKP